MTKAGNPPANLNSGYEILAQVSLGVRERINSYQTFLSIIEDEQRWGQLSLVDHRNLANRLGTKGLLGEGSALFTKKIRIKYRSDKGTVLNREVDLLLNSSKNDTLNEIFQSINNPEVATAFWKELGFGLISHIQKIFEVENESLEERLLCFSRQDLEAIDHQQAGFSVNLIPRFVRIPLHVLYTSIMEHSSMYPSLALQFHLDTYFNTKDNTAQELVRTLMSKSFAAILRKGGLSPQDVEEPDVKRNERHRYLTLSDDDSHLVALDENYVVVDKNYLQILEQRVEPQNQPDIDAVKADTTIERKVSVEGVAIKIDLTLDQILTDSFTVYVQNNPNQNLIWMPTVTKLSDAKRQQLQIYLNRIFDPRYLNRLSEYERSLISFWTQFAQQEYADPRIKKLLDALHIDENQFTQQVQLCFAARHKEIVEQNQDTVIKALTGNLMPTMLLNGTITPAQFVQNRYQQFQEILGYLYNFNLSETQAWIPSPYPVGAVLSLVNNMDQMLAAEGTLASLKPKLALAKQILYLMIDIDQQGCPRL